MPENIMQYQDELSQHGRQPDLIQFMWCVLVLNEFNAISMKRLYFFLVRSLAGGSFNL